MSWLRDLICGPCECAEAVTPTVVSAVKTVVPPTSPARLLARSLTDPETRGEWETEPSDLSYTYGQSTRYRNKKRDIAITRWWLAYAGSGVSTPFKLSKAEEKVVIDAIEAWLKHRSDLAEQAALARLTAQAGEARSDETPKSVSARRASTRSRRDAPK